MEADDKAKRLEKMINEMDIRMIKRFSNMERGSLFGIVLALFGVAITLVLFGYQAILVKDVVSFFVSEIAAIIIISLAVYKVMPTIRKEEDY